VTSTERNQKKKKKITKEMAGRNQGQKTVHTEKGKDIKYRKKTEEDPTRRRRLVNAWSGSNVNGDAAISDGKNGPILVRGEIKMGRNKYKKKNVVAARKRYMGKGAEKRNRGEDSTEMLGCEVQSANTRNKGNGPKQQKNKKKRETNKTINKQGGTTR